MTKTDRYVQFTSLINCKILATHESERIFEVDFSDWNVSPFVFSSNFIGSDEHLSLQE